MPLLIQLGFPLVTLTFYWLLYQELGRGIGLSNFTEEKKKKIRKRITLGFVVWVMIMSGLSLSGFLSDFSAMPPRPAIVLTIPFIVIIWATRSPITTEILNHIPAQNLIRLQTFRIFVEILLWKLFMENLLPVQMSFEGRNFDILSGITALLVAWLMARNKVSNSVVIVWNFLCLGLLINIVVIAILSMPLPFRVFMNEPANTIVMKFPIVFLPGLLVPLAYGLHFLSLKQLLMKK